MAEEEEAREYSFLGSIKDREKIRRLLRDRLLRHVVEFFNACTDRYHVMCSREVYVELQKELGLDDNHWDKPRYFIIADNEKRRETRDQLAKVDPGYTYEHWDDKTDCYNFTCSTQEVEELKARGFIVRRDAPLTTLQMAQVIGVRAGM
jgi:hypothetical protein